jgi:hypothetical protein
MTNGRLPQRAWDRLSRGRCAKCEAIIFQPGPAGGAAQNVECIACGTRFNVTIHCGVLIFAQIIGRRPFIDDWDRYRAMCNPGILPIVAAEEQ